MATSIEIVRRVWDDDEGVCLEIGVAEENSDWIAIAAPSGKSEEYYGALRLLLDKEMARLVADGILAALND